MPAQYVYYFVRQSVHFKYFAIITDLCIATFHPLFIAYYLVIDFAPVILVKWDFLCLLEIDCLFFAKMPLLKILNILRPFV